MIPKFIALILSNTLVEMDLIDSPFNLPLLFLINIGKNE